MTNSQDPPWGRFLDPQVHRHLIDGEYIEDEVHRHPMAMARPILGLFVTMAMFLAMPFLRGAYWLGLLIGLGVFGWSLWRIAEEIMDRFVVTNMRVFRVHGVIAQHIATVPMQRILDISVHIPVLGRIFNYGHFVFESAAQEQGLREIRFVGRPEERDLKIQQVIQRSGVRGRAPKPVGGES